MARGRKGTKKREQRELKEPLCNEDDTEEEQDEEDNNDSWEDNAENRYLTR